MILKVFGKIIDTTQAYKGSCVIGNAIESITFLLTALSYKDVQLFVLVEFTVGYRRGKHLSI